MSHVRYEHRFFTRKSNRAKETHDWIVEPPRDRISAVEIKVFTGPRAQQLALTYAYEEYGNARFFPSSLGLGSFPIC